MNKIKETKIKLGRTVNIGDFENYKPELEITFEGEVNYAEAFKLVQEEIELEADRLRTNVKNSQNVPPPVPKAQNDFPDKEVCEVHKVPLKTAVSKKTDKPYTYHRSTDGQMCFGKGYV